jgi:hypothetical protein
MYHHAVDLVETQMGPEIPATLNDAIAAQSGWLQAWVMTLVVTHLLAVAFIVQRTPEGWRVRFESVAILVSFFAAAVFMSWLYTRVGYVRLLGVAHLVFWTPAYVWVLSRRRAIGVEGLYGKYLLLYLVVAGTSLVIDVIDLVRYLLGEG